MTFKRSTREEIKAMSFNELMDAFTESLLVLEEAARKLKDNKPTKQRKPGDKNGPSNIKS